MGLLNPTSKEGDTMKLIAKLTMLTRNIEKIKKDFESNPQPKNSLGHYLVVKNKLLINEKNIEKCVLINGKRDPNGVVERMRTVLRTQEKLVNHIRMMFQEMNLIQGDYVLVPIHNKKGVSIIEFLEAISDGGEQLERIKTALYSLSEYLDMLTDPRRVPHPFFYDIDEDVGFLTRKKYHDVLSSPESYSIILIDNVIKS